ncbi:hypothetical protein DDE82_003309 [Stemphylium lycopersici]|nr:hypothetical protein DDE82_003309 [Stemphylium lycopersici]
MGGFALDIDDTDFRNAVLFNGAKRLTLTAKGIALLAQCGHIPDVSLDDIKDKNKADGLAKLLVCIQAGWMIVQVISRTASGLPTTLLEVHVVAHVVCALIMYILWWHKPRQVTSPTLLKGGWLPLAAYMYLASRMSGKVPQGTFALFRVATPELEKLAYFEEKEARPEDHDPADCSSRAQPRASGHLGTRPNIQHSERECETTVQDPETEASSELRRLSEDALLLYPVLRSRFAPARERDAPGSTYSIPYVTELVQSHALDWPNDGLLRRTQSLIMGMVLWGASTAYGAIHVAAWNYFFPSELEQLFWRLSSIWVTFCAAFWLVTNLLAYVFPFIDRIWVAYNKRSLGWFSTVVITLLWDIVLEPIYHVARRPEWSWARPIIETRTKPAHRFRLKKADMSVADIEYSFWQKQNLAVLEISFLVAYTSPVLSHTENWLRTCIAGYKSLPRRYRDDASVKVSSISLNSVGPEETDLVSCINFYENV